MREIKFRAWDKETEIMFFVEAIKLLPPNQGFLMFNGKDYNGKNCILQQFTGLKDKNGKEIYDGDVVKYIWQRGDVTGQREVAEVKFEKGEFWPREFKWYDEDNFLQSNSKLEVIGNIYENPELLK